MSVLVIIDHAEGEVKKSTPELLSYGTALAAQLGTEVQALVLGTVSQGLESLGKYGVQKIYQVTNNAFDSADGQALAKAISTIADNVGADVVVFPDGDLALSVAPRVSVRLKAGFVSGVSSLPKGESFVVKKAVFSGKAFAWNAIKTVKKVISLSSNSFGIKETEGVASIETIAIDDPISKVTVKERNIIKGEIPLGEASVVVSAGRGLKGPENWGIVEDLAHALNAGLACSRPVSDSDWRPHHEHVGQTGKQIAPNLYIAAGISGAIQHLGGVNRSKVIVVINKDPEAPFFKAADYGIVGDVFEVLPRLTEAVKNLN
ncbi:MAG: electron transfer flavoprotein subunit alpha [Pseudopedobacter saltans]|uniref:Electron transfer flavoprotein subunit alpha n=1 Tax=Pseudopedobacter saltans TaxID=151895 RepID=A0A2W5FFU3_9SPHI|nr:MAG: electron transfer flavoprotein subunit alpha [Pseudopedobacter saltans]